MEFGLKKFLILLLVITIFLNILIWYVIYNETISSQILEITETNQIKINEMIQEMNENNNELKNQQREDLEKLIENQIVEIISKINELNSFQKDIKILNEFMNGVLDIPEDSKNGNNILMEEIAKNLEEMREKGDDEVKSELLNLSDEINQIFNVLEILQNQGAIVNQNFLHEEEGDDKKEKRIEGENTNSITVGKKKNYNDYVKDINWDKVSLDIAKNSFYFPIDFVTQYNYAIEDIIRNGMVNHSVDISEYSYFPPKHDCTEPLYKTFLNQIEEKTPKIIFDLILFAHEVDVLEMRLYELENVVDYFVIMENDISHRGARKPLYFSMIRDRFKKFEKKIIYFNWDDSIHSELFAKNMSLIHKDDWDIENLQRVVIVSKLKDYWLARYKENLPSKSYFIVGDCDEIPDAVVLNNFKNCKLKEPNEDHLFNLEWYQFTFKFEELNIKTIERPYIRSLSKLNEIDGKMGKLKNAISMCQRYKCGSHLTTFGSLIWDLVKQLNLAEGGYIVEGLNYFKYPESFRNETEQIGRRVCCNRVERSLRKSWSSSLWLPNIVKKFPERYKFFVPDILFDYLQS